MRTAGAIDLRRGTGAGGGAVSRMTRGLYSTAAVITRASVKAHARHSIFVESPHCLLRDGRHQLAFRTARHAALGKLGTEPIVEEPDSDRRRQQTSKWRQENAADLTV